MPENSIKPTQKPASDVEKPPFFSCPAWPSLKSWLCGLPQAQYTTTIPLIAATVAGIGGLLWLLQAAYDSYDLFDPDIFIPGFIYLVLCIGGAWLVAWLICWQVSQLKDERDKIRENVWKRTLPQESGQGREADTGEKK